MENCNEITKCLCCNSENLRTIFDLGKQPLANSYHNGENLPIFPLALRLCKECFHVQLSHSVNPDIIFKNYAYLSGISKTMLNYYEWFATEVIEAYPDAKNVFEIACNDGSQLDAFKNHGFETYGCDPAENIMTKTLKKGHQGYVGYFSTSNNNFWSHLDLSVRKTFDVVVAQNVIAHVPEPLEFLKCCNRIMHEHSVLYIQTSQSEMIEKAQFDTIYHEHLSFFNINSMKILLERAGLVLNRVFKTHVHGSSYVFMIHKQIIPTINNVENQLKSEEYLRKELPYYKFAFDVYRFKEVFLGKMERFTHGKRIIGYGCSAKGVNLIALTGIKPEVIIDNATTKQEKMTPGSNIPIHSNDYILGIKEDLVFIPLAWNFYEEIKAQIKTLRPNNNDQFIRFSTHDFLQIQIE